MAHDGVAVLGQHGNDLFELLAAADVALYRAKERQGKQGRGNGRVPVGLTPCLSSSIRCALCARRTATRSSSITSRWPSCPAPRSASWARTEPASRPCSG